MCHSTYCQSSILIAISNITSLCSSVELALQQLDKYDAETAVYWRLQSPDRTVILVDIVKFVHCHS